jgi:PAS domain S-box-containing protein
MDAARDGGFQAELMASQPVLVKLAAAALVDPGMLAPGADERQLLRALIDQVPDLLFVKDYESRFILANHATAHDVGEAEPDDLVGKTDLDFYEAPLAQKYLRQEHDIMFEGLPFIDVEEPSKNTGEGGKWFSVTKVPLRDKSGEVIGLVGCCRDITARKRVERLQQGEAAILERIAGTPVLRRFSTRCCSSSRRSVPRSRPPSCCSTRRVSICTPVRRPACRRPGSTPSRASPSVRASAPAAPPPSAVSPSSSPISPATRCGATGATRSAPMA